MSDNITKKQRSYCMSRIRNKNTYPEISFKEIFKGFKDQPKMFGHPDFVDKKNKTVVFIDGCFWHKCSKHFKRPKTNMAYWDEKIRKNVIRDKKVNSEYKNKGWKVVRLWEHHFR